MRTAASRLPKGFSLEERLAACASNVESRPKDRAGQWRCWAPLGERRGDPYAAVVLDLGCGKGEYTVECAAARPDVLFVGLDVDGVCVMRAGGMRHCARRVECRVRAARRLRFVGNVWRGRAFRNAAEFPHAVPEKEEGALPAHAFRATYVVSSAVGAGRIRSVAHRQHAAARFLAHSARDRGL